MSVEVRLLRYFLAVADELHFGRAAGRLYVSQPALSQQIRKLEVDLGADLFVRDRRHVELTGAGRALLAPAQRAVAASDDFTAAARSAVRAERREVALGFLVPWPDSFVPRVLRELRRRRPEIVVDVRQYDYRDTSLGLRSGEADVSLLHPPFDLPGIRTHTLFRVTRVAMISDDHPLSHRDAVTVAELVATGMPWATPPPEADQTWREFWSALPERLALGAGEVEAMVPLTQDAYLSQVATGRALGLADSMIEAAYHHPPGIAFVPVADLSPGERVVGWRADDDRDDVHELVRTIITTAGEGLC